MAFQLLTATTTVWIIDTLFQLVSSGIKIFFMSQVMNYLLPVHTIGVRHTPPATRLNRVFPDIPVVPGLQETGKAGHCCV